MKNTWISVLALLVVVVSAAAFADSVNDPKVIIHGTNARTPSTFSSCEGCMPVGLNFTFGVPDDGTGQLLFTNASGKNWTSLTLVEDGTVPATDITCVTTLFLSCTEKTGKDGSVAIMLSGIKGIKNPRIGILNGQSFAIQFACVENDCWPGGLDFTAHAGAVPEPGTAVLVLTGVGALVSRRQLWKTLFHS